VLADVVTMELDEDVVGRMEVVVDEEVSRVDDWLEDEETAVEEEDADVEVVDFVEAERAYPPAPAAITIITIATITAAVLLIARLFLTFMPTHQMT